MILDSIHNEKCTALSDPRFVAALKFVHDNADTLPVGQYYLDGDNLFVTIFEGELRSAAESRLEVHRRYIDIQVVISGEETFGWSVMRECCKQDGPFDTEKDIVFFGDKPSTYITAHEGEFVIFFPQDAHAPLIGTGKVRKAIVKVRVIEP